MATTAGEALLKSQPDVSKLNNFSGHTVTVTKHLQPRNATGQMVVTTQPMLLKQILDLQMTLPIQHGPGYYRFEVCDTGGTGDDKWLVKFGPDIQEVSSMAMAGPTTPYVGGPSGPAPVLSEGVRQIGPGYFYDQDLGTLVTPWREIVQWRPGEPLPKAPTNAAATALPAASGWGGGPYMPPPGFGYPNNDSSDNQRLKDQLADERRAREAAENRAEMRRIEEANNRRSDEQERKFELLIAKLTEKPSGPDPHVQRIEQELAEQRRRSEERERELRMQEQIRAQQERTDAALRELSANKTDPMMSLFTTLMAATQTSATESVKAIRESVAATAASSERQMATALAQIQTTAMSPTTLLQIVQSARADGGEMSRTMVAAMKDLMGTQKDVYGQMLEVAGSSGQPAWLTAVQAVMDKAGTVGAAVMEARSQQAQAPQPQMQQPRAVQQRPPQAQQLQPQQQQRAVQAVPRAAGPETPAEERARLASGVTHLRPPPPEGIVHATAFNGSTGPATVAPIVEVLSPGAPAQAPQVAAAVVPPHTRAPRASRNKPKRPRRRRNVTTDTPPADPAGYTGAQIRDMDPKVLAENLAMNSDDWFFGSLIQAVGQLRANSGALPPDAMAGYVLQGREQLRQQGDELPPAMQLLVAEQYEVLIDRLLPEMPADYRAAVVEQLATLIAAENGVTEEGGGEEEGDDEEEEAGGEGTVG